MKPLGLMDAIARGIALTAAVAVLVYPVRAFLALEGVPLALRLAWLVVAVGAVAAPRVSLLLFVAGAPLLPTLPYIMGWPRVTLAELWLFALLVPAALQVALGRQPWRSGLPPAVPLLAVLTTASLVVTLYPFHLAAGGFGPLARALHQFARDDLVVTVSQRHPYASVLAWAIVIEGLALLWLVASHVNESSERMRRISHLLVAAAAGAVLVALYGTWQWWTGRHLLEFWAETDPLIRRVNATFSDPNGLGAYMAMGLWLVVGVLASVPDRPPRIAWVGGAVVLAAALVFTASRSAWTAAAVGAVAFVAMFLKKTQERAATGRRLRRIAVAALAAGIVMVAGLTLFATHRDVRHSDQRTYIHTLLYTLNLNTPIEERLKGRVALWDAAVRMIAERPVFGIGIGRYYKTLYSYAPDPDKLVTPQENAHNYFLQIGAELGLAGLAALATVLALGVVGAMRAADHQEHRATAVMAIATSVAVITYMATWLAGHPLLVREGQYAFWPVVAAALALNPARRAVAGTMQAATPNRFGQVAVCAAAVLTVALVPWRATREARRVNLAELTSGMYDREVDPDGRPYNWSTAHATFYVPSNVRAFTLPLRSLAPVSQTVSVYVDGALANRIALTDHAWHRLRFQLPARRGAPSFYRYELRVEPVWRPSDADSRTLGVIIGEREVTR